MPVEGHLCENLAEGCDSVVFLVRVVGVQDVDMYETLDSLQWVVVALCPREPINPVFAAAF